MQLLLQLEVFISETTDFMSVGHTMKENTVRKLTVSYIDNFTLK